MSADFPGHLRHYLEEITGGHVLYINGAVGNQIGPHGPVWEVSEQFPITGIISLLFQFSFQLFFFLVFFVFFSFLKKN